MAPRPGPLASSTIYWPQSGPISGWHPTTYPVRVRLQDIRTHDGQPSYRKLAEFYVNRRGVTKVLYFTFSVLPGGSVPAWNWPGAGSLAGAEGRPGWPRTLPTNRPLTAPAT